MVLHMFELKVSKVPLSVDGISFSPTSADVWRVLGDLTTTLGIRQVERATAVKPLKLRDTVVEPLMSRVG